MRLQRLVRIRQNLPNRALPSVASAVCQEMETAEWTRAVKPGCRIAIGVGSRDIANIDVIVRTMIDFWKLRGAKPFVIPVMGSHGAATAKGQADVLAHYGITEATMGAPIVSSLGVVTLGKTPEGIEVVMSHDALEADGVVLCSRVKWHTAFEGKLESGMHKMMTIGLGKLTGAQRYHTYGLKLGLEQVIRSVGRKVLDTGKILGGLAILEDAYHQIAEVAAVGADNMVKREEELLARVKSWKANVPVKELDLLVIEEIGKNFSGVGMDTKVVNRAGRDRANCWPGVPIIHRIFLRDLSPLSYGNAIGIGMADVITDQLYNKIDFKPMWINSLTASNPTPSAVPMHFSNDYTCIEKIAPTCGKIDLADVSISWIRNTMKLDELMISENLLPELNQNPDIEILSPPQEIEFNSEGNLVSAFASEAVAH